MEPWQRWASERWLRWHRNAYLGVIGALTLVNIVLGGWWWSFWPMFAWGIVFFFHLCLVKALHVEDGWVEDRTDELRLKSYDLSHIDSIEERYGSGARPGPSRRRRPGTARYPIVDAHQHFWDLERNPYPWLRDEPLIPSRHGDYRLIRRTYLPEHFRADVGPLNVVATVHVEAEWDRADPVGETAWLHELHDRTGLPSAVVAHARLDDPDVETVLDAHRAYPLVRSIRHKPAAAADPGSVRAGAPGSMGDPAWRRGYARLGDHGLAFDLQTPYWHLAEAADLAQAFPRTLIIVNHAGLPTHRDRAGLAAWRRAMQTIAAEPNVVAKISGLGEPHLQPWSVARHRDVVLETIEIFGADRCMIGSNYPVERLYAPYSAVMTGLMEITSRLSLRERRWLFRDNAATYYRIAL